MIAGAGGRFSFSSWDGASTFEATFEAIFCYFVSRGYFDFLTSKLIADVSAALSFLAEGRQARKHASQTRKPSRATRGATTGHDSRARRVRGERHATLRIHKLQARIQSVRARNGGD